MLATPPQESRAKTQEGDTAIRSVISTAPSMDRPGHASRRTEKKDFIYGGYPPSLGIGRFADRLKRHSERTVRYEPPKKAILRPVSALSDRQDQVSPSRCYWQNAPSC